MKVCLRTIIRTFLLTAILVCAFHFSTYIKPLTGGMLFAMLAATFIILLIFVLACGSLVYCVVCLIRKKKPGVLSIASITTMVTLIICALIINIIPFPERLPAGSNLRKFDPVIWKHPSSTDYNEGISEREKMLKDLVTQVLPGKSKDEIIGLLGEPLETLYFRKINKDMIYYLGPERDNFLSIDSEWLLIWLDKDKYFKKYRIRND